jgi:hypothetical protein
MENEYNRPILQISYWCVSINDIKTVFDFFDKRISDSKIKSIDLEADFTSGNSIRVKKIEDFLNKIKLRVREKENLIRVEMQIFYHDLSHEKLKDLFLRINFDRNWTEFEVRASDCDGSLKDWVDGTYEEMLRIKNRFEMEKKYRKYFLEKVKNKNSTLEYYLIFDPFKKIEKQIMEEFDIEEKTKKEYRESTPRIVINGNNNFANNSNNKFIEKSFNNQATVDNKEKWHQRWWGQIIIVLAGALLVYLLGWN